MTVAIYAYDAMALAVNNRAGERRPDQTMSALCATDQQVYYY